MTVKNDNDDDSDGVKVKSVPFPKCEATTSVGELPTWAGLIEQLHKAHLATTDSLEQAQGSIDPKVAIFSQMTAETVFEQVFACLPQFVSQPNPEEHYDDYAPLDESGGKEEHEVNDSEVMTGLVEKVKKLMTRMKEIFKKSYDSWEQKDSFLLVCSAPGVFSALVLVLQLCMKSGVKRYTSELRDRERHRN